MHITDGIEIPLQIGPSSTRKVTAAIATWLDSMLTINESATFRIVPEAVSARIQIKYVDNLPL